MNRSLCAVVATTAMLSGLLTCQLATSSMATATTGDVALNEIESQSRAGGGDWVEIINVSGGPLSIGGWKVRDLAGNSVTVPAATGLRPGGRFVFEMGSVLDSQDVVILTDSTGTDVDWFDWFSHADGTWSRCQEGTGSFLDSVPTKGTANPCRGPEITASISSTVPITANGWYGGPVTVTYSCQAGSAPITSCSLPQTLYSTGADHEVVGSVFDTNGASDTVRLKGINIDRLGPKLVIKGVKNGKKYDAKQSPKVKASDLHSGMAMTKVVQKPKYYPELTKWFVHAYAWDQAGNVTAKKLMYAVRTQQG